VDGFLFMRIHKLINKLCKITRKIKDCGLLLDVAVLDHIIVGDDRFYFFADEGAM